MILIENIKKLAGHKGFQRYAKNTTWLLLERVLRIISGLFVGILVARYLGPEQFGNFNYIVSFVGLFAAFSSLGLDVILVRELVKNESRLNSLLGTVFILKLAGAIFTILLIFISFYFTSNDYNTNVMMLIVAMVTIFSSFNVVDLYFQAKVKSKYSVYVNIIMLCL